MGIQATLSFPEQQEGKTPPSAWSREVLRTHWDSGVGGGGGTYPASLVTSKDTPTSTLWLAVGERWARPTASCPVFCPVSVAGDKDGQKVVALLDSERQMGS